MLEPQSTALFILLMAAFFALLIWVALTRQPAVRVFAAALAFVPAMLFGMAAVNKYYDYYQTWGSVAADVGAQGLSAAIPQDLSSQSLTAVLGKVTGGRLAAEQGETVRFTVPGRLSHLTRTTYVYLPPQYFQQPYRQYRFPVIELIPGFPGVPQDWINVVGVTQAFLTLLRDHLAKPAVLVMPDANGGPRVSLQCLNVVRGPQDATFLAVDLPEHLAREIRVQPSGRAWGIAGYSEGGYCAANLALLYPSRYGYAGVLSGYFRPFWDRLGTPPRTVNPFGHNAGLRRKNTPQLRVTALPVYVHIPDFWLGAGSGDPRDVNAARSFQRVLLLRQPTAQVHLADGGGHTMATWRALIPPMLEWMTPLLTDAADRAPAAHVAHAGAAPRSAARSATASPPRA